MKTPNRRRYNALLKRQKIYETWAEQFKQKNGWIIIPADARPPVKFTNAERTEIELFDWLHDPPEKYFLYIRAESREAITFTGAVLGSVYPGRVYRSNFGDKRQHITLHGTNGKTYHGIYYCGAGDYARVHMVKGAKP